MKLYLFQMTNAWGATPSIAPLWGNNSPIAPFLSLLETNKRGTIMVSQPPIGGGYGGIVPPWGYAPHFYLKTAYP